MTLTLDQLLYTLLEAGSTKSVVFRKNKNPKGLKYTVELFDEKIHIEEESSFSNSGNNLRDLVAETLSNTPPKLPNASGSKDRQGTGRYIPKFPFDRGGRRMKASRKDLRTCALIVGLTVMEDIVASSTVKLECNERLFASLMMKMAKTVIVNNPGITVESSTNVDDPWGLLVDQVNNGDPNPKSTTE